MNRFAYLERLATAPSETEVEVTEAEEIPPHTFGDAGLALPPAAVKRGREGKRSNPDFERMAVYVSTETRRKARRKFEDETGKKCDESILVQKLLSQYVAG